jgi:hypothetical protein
MKKNKIRIGLWGTLTGVSAGLMCIFLIGSGVAGNNKSVVDKTLNVTTSKIVHDSSAVVGDTEYYKSSYTYDKAGETKLVSDAFANYQKVVEEGVTLLKNNNKALPVSKTSSVAVFGNAAPSYFSSFDTEFKKAGLKFNDDSWSYYKAAKAPTAKVAVNEPAWSDVTSQAWFGSVKSDLAIVVLSRRGGEGSDCPSDPNDTHYGDYLALTQNEIDMMKGVKALKDAGSISKVLVILSTSNMIDSEFINDDAYGIDACLWTGSSSSTQGLCDGVINIIDGDVNPSGRTVDCIYKDNQLYPVVKNIGSIDADLSSVTASLKKDVQDKQLAWWGAQGDFWQENLVYQEGIYHGYRYSETRYEDYVMGAANVGDFKYDDLIAYPFGTGLSYTDFTYSNYKLTKDNDNFLITVDVKNNGTVDGKHSVPVYAQSPYTKYDKENLVEKSSVQLVGFTKTDVIKAGDTQKNVTITIPKKTLRAYDANKAKTYIFDDGDYYFTIGESAHEAVNNILASKGFTPSSTSNKMDKAGDPNLVASWTNASFDGKTYATSDSGYAITNQFDDVNPNKDVYCSKDNQVTFTTRQNWKDTTSSSTIHIKYNDDMVKQAYPETYVADASEQKKTTMPKFGVSNGLKIVSFRGVKYDDASWSKLLEQMTYKEMLDFVMNSGTNAISSIGLPSMGDNEGSTGTASNLVASGLKTTSLPSTDLRAATFNRDLWKADGNLNGEGYLHASTASTKRIGLNGFSTDLHRSPYGGRNGEYYSEDGFLAGVACSTEVAGMEEKGCLNFVKHFFLNDQDTNRHGVSTWANEQTIRECYLVPFEAAIVDGHTRGLMNSFNRIGMTWVGQHKGAQINYLEGELNWHGAIITDMYETDYQDAVDGLLAGTTIWLAGNVAPCYAAMPNYEKDPVVVNALVEAVHRDLYEYANTFMMNGLSSTDKVVTITSWWATTISLIDLVFEIGTAACGTMLVLNIMKKNKQKEAAAQ